MKIIDIAVAVRNEELNIPTFIDGVRKIKFSNCTVRMIFVEDGSKDNTLVKLKEIAEKSEDVAYYSINNPYGQGYALLYGIMKSDADAIITMDVDSSHPLSTTKVMIEKYLQGFDVVQGKRIVYDNRPIYRKAGSFIYVLFFSLISATNFFRQNVHFRFMNRTALEIFKKHKSWWYTTRTRFKKQDNLKICYLEFNSKDRFSGESKFNMKRIIHSVFGSFVTLIHPAIWILLNVFFIVISWFSFDKNYFIISLIVLLVSNLILINHRIRLIEFKESSLLDSKSFPGTYLLK